MELFSDLRFKGRDKLGYRGHVTQCSYLTFVGQVYRDADGYPSIRRTVCPGCAHDHGIVSGFWLVRSEFGSVNKNKP